MSAMRQRLNGLQISVLRILMRRNGVRTRAGLNKRLQTAALDLWRRGLIEVWYRQMPSCAPSLRGPYYSLTETGTQLASAFMAPRRAH